MNKSDLIDHISKIATLNKAQSENALKAIFEGITLTLKKGEEARFVGFGTFKIQNRAARNGRNPRTGAELKIKASKNVGFKAGKELKNHVN